MSVMGVLEIYSYRGTPSRAWSDVEWAVWIMGQLVFSVYRGYVTVQAFGLDLWLPRKTRHLWS